jgi:hypothetical protein
MATRSAIEAVESGADVAMLALDLLSYPRNLACWVALTSIVMDLERVRSQSEPYGRYFLNALSVNGHVGAMLVNWIFAKENAVSVPHTRESEMRSIAA